MITWHCPVCLLTLDVDHQGSLVLNVCHFYHHNLCRFYQQHQLEKNRYWHRWILVWIDTSLFVCLVIFHAYCVVCWLFSKLTFFLNYFTIRVSNGLDSDQHRHCVGPDLGPNCLQRLSEDNKSQPSKGLGGEAFTRKYIIWPLRITGNVPSTSCKIFRYKAWSC